MNIWQKLKAQNKPFFALAPLDDVSDTVFREVVIRTAAPDIVFTEFANTDGYVHPEGRGSVMRKLQVNDSERQLGVPLIAQIWGKNPEHYYQTAKELAAGGLYAGIDINMGCPEKNIVKRGCCAGLIEQPELAAQIIAATKEGAGNLPVSVKTRLGLRTIKTEDWAGHLLRQNIAGLTIHGRTAKEMSKVPAHWGEISKVVMLRDAIAPHTVITGNGDVGDRRQGNERAQKSGVDGIMIGRGIFQNILAFNDSEKGLSITERFDLLHFHIDLWEQTWSNSKSFEPLKKFMKVYISGFPGASDLRARLMQTRKPDDARRVIADALALV